MRTLKMFLRVSSFCILVGAITITSCKRKTADQVVDPNPDLTTERDVSNADNDNNSLVSDIDKAFDNGVSSSNLREESSGYATVYWADSSTTFNGVSYDKILVITYSGTIASDGQSRSGSTTVFYTGARISETFKAYATFTGTKVGGRTITGTKTITQEPSGDPNKWKFVIVAAGTVTTIDGKTMTYSSNRTRIRTGISTLGNLTDDSFTITGSWNGTNGNGESVTANISSPLQLVYSCHYFREITSGKIDFTNNSTGITRSIDYGSGNCDGEGTFINANGKSFTFLFKR